MSSDYLLGVDTTSTVCVSGLTEEDIHIVCALIEHLRRSRGEEQK